MSDRQELADLYVAGLLDDAEAVSVAQRLSDPRDDADRALARAVGASRDRFLDLDLTAPEVPLRSAAWDRLAAALDRGQAVDAGPDAAPAGLAAAGGGWWRASAMAAMAASVLLAVALIWQVQTEDNPTVVAVLINDAGAAVAMVRAYEDDRFTVIPLEGAEAGPAQVFQVWTKPDPDGPPVSIGLLDAMRRLDLVRPDLPPAGVSQFFEITIEPEGGSPTGLPTGPIVGKGFAYPA